MWKLTYDAPVGLRTNRGFWNVKTDSGNLWYCAHLNKWIKLEDRQSFAASSAHNKPKTTKAFIRYLNKHPELKGCKVTLVHPQCLMYTDGETIDFHIHAEWVDIE